MPESLQHIIEQGDIEEYGTGYKRLREWFSEYPELYFTISDLNGFIQAKTAENVPENVPEKKLPPPDSRTDRRDTKTKNDPVNNPVSAPVSERHLLILQLIRENKFITQAELATKCEVSVETIKRDIRKLQEQKQIKRTGSDKSGHWQIIKNQE